MVHDSEQRATKIVAIGASAGGIAALQRLFQTLPAEPAAAFVVIQHSSASSLLVDLIARWTAMTVTPARDGDRPQVNCVYVARPDELLTLEGGAFRTRPTEKRPRHPAIETIDTFFESLATDLAERAIVVVLSGTGCDGTAGALLVKQAGGTVLVQDPVTAEQDSMPRSVIDRNAADHVLSLDQLAQQIVASAADAGRRSDAFADNLRTSLAEILELIRRHAGFDLSGYKTTPLLWRIQQRMTARRSASLPDYVALLRDDRAELEAIIRGIPIHVTEFFRDPEAWAALDSEVIEALVAERGSHAPIRAWTPACSTGEEAYSLAMLLAERATPFRLFATDAWPEVLARASAGRFAATSLAGLSRERQARFLYSADGAFRIKRELREHLVFAPHDMLSDPPLGGLDLISCRNLLMYLGPETRERVVFLLHGALRPGGYLFLGKAESLLHAQAFEPISLPWRIYRKTGALPVPKAILSRKPRDVASATGHRAAVEQFDLPGVLIDDQLAVLHVYGDTSGFLQLPAGQPTTNVLALVDPALATELQMAIDRALAHDHPIIAGVPDSRPDHIPASLRVTPLPVVEGGTRRLLVSFFPRDIMPIAPGGDWEDAARISREELEASREELMAVNEELRASNDQLHVAHDDLLEANTQLALRLAELEMQSKVLSSGGVATLFLDRELRIRWYTPAVVELFPLRPADVGRRITDLVMAFDDAAMFDDIATVIRTGAPSEAEVRDHRMRWFLRRISPYRMDGETTGVALTFANVTDGRAVSDALRESEAELMRGEVWLRGQKDAFQGAIGGAPLETSLGMLVRITNDKFGEGVRCAFYLLGPEGKTLHHLVGMPESYGHAVDGFRVAPDSLACGLAAYTAKPVITPDIREEPRWKEWLALAAEYDYRGCWSLPIELDGKILGTLAIYHRQPRDATARDLQYGGVLTRAAALIISRYRQTENRS